jgi:hypothetical protein
VGIVFSNHMNDDEESEFQLTIQHGVIRKCKPGIWRSAVKQISRENQVPGVGLYIECLILYM